MLICGFRWVKDEMTVVSVNGEEPSFSAAVLWPESHNKYHFEIQGYNYRMTVFNASLKDASNVSLVGCLRTKTAAIGVCACNVLCEVQFQFSQVEKLRGRCH